VTAPTPDSGLERLRDDIDTLTGLVQSTADHLGIDRAFVEKDFWVTELLRSVAGGDSIIDATGAEQPVTAIFKGGTSLSRVFGIIERFSEDVDILLVFPDNASVGARDKALKRLGERAREHLGLTPDKVTTQESTRGVKRNLQYLYPRTLPSTHVREYLLLEMGSRGGPNPHEAHTMRSMVAEYAESHLGEGPDTWAEFAPATVQVLAPERTLLEKLTLLHDLASRFPDEAAQQGMARAGRHYYDIKGLLETPAVRAALADLGPAGVTAIVEDINTRSAEAGWSYSPRPNGGFAESAAFDPQGPIRPIAQRSYEVAMGMVHGTKVPFDDCFTAVNRWRELL
jgi:hypothetical protein